MVACNSAERSACDMLPQALNIRLRTQRRRALIKSALLQHVILGHGKIVRAGFRGDVISLALRRGDSVGDVRAAHMADMHPAAGRLSQLDDGRRGDHFGGHRTGVQKACQSVRPLESMTCSRCLIME